MLDLQNANFYKNVITNKINIEVDYKIFNLDIKIDTCRKSYKINFLRREITKEIGDIIGTLYQVLNEI